MYGYMCIYIYMHKPHNAITSYYIIFDLPNSCCRRHLTGTSRLSVYWSIRCLTLYTYI